MEKLEKFYINKREHNDIVILELNGYLDAHTSPIFEKELESIIENKIYKIIINFKNLDYISSAGLGVFMGYIENVRNNNGDIKLTEMNSKVFSVFDLLGFPALFDIDITEIDSIKRFENKN